MRIVSNKLNLNRKGYNQNGEYIDSSVYAAGILKGGREDGGEGRSDLQGFAFDNLYKPVWDTYLQFLDEKGWKLQNGEKPTPFLK